MKYAIVSFVILVIGLINMGNTPSNEPYYIGQWKSNQYSNIKGTIKVPQLIINNPGKTTASVTYDDSSTYNAGVTLEMTIESYYNNGALIYTSTISNGFILNIFMGPQIVTYTPTERSPRYIKGTYKSIQPEDHGKFTLTL